MDLLTLFSFSFISLLLALYGLASILAHRTFKRLNSIFEMDPILKTYQEATPLVYIPQDCQRCLLVITGFANTPLGLKNLVEQLDKNIGYYIPRNIGWGRCDFRMAHHVEWQDWVLRYQEAYLLLKSFCPRVDIVAHSAGCNIAAFLVAKFEVKRLYLIAPNFIHNPQHKYHKVVLLFPYIGAFLCQLIPLFPDGVNSNYPQKYIEKGYYHTSIPTNSVKQMWLMQDECMHISSWRVKDRTWIMMDPFDQVVGSMEEQIKLISKRTSTLKIQILKKAGHNVQSMPENIVKTMVDIITKN